MSDFPEIPADWQTMSERLQEIGIQYFPDYGAGFTNQGIRISQAAPYYKNQKEAEGERIEISFTLTRRRNA